jgi:hypothetical protein
MPKAISGEEWFFLRFSVHYQPFMQKAAPYKKRFDPSQIIATYIAVLLHELAHCLLVWWSRGNCRTPDLGPLLRESGCFIEEAFLGGVLEGWWDKNREGQFKYLRSLVIETPSGRFLELGKSIQYLIRWLWFSGL